MKKITLLMALIVSAFAWQTSAQNPNFQGTTGAIPDGSCPDGVTFNADVTGLGTIGDTWQIDEVVVNITHTWDADLEFALVAPDGVTSLALSIANGGSDDNYTNTVFTDEGNPPSITTGSAPFTGVFSPQGGSFADAFNGLDANGLWTLAICDNTNADTGTVDQWSIRFQPNPVSCPAPFNVEATDITSTTFELSWQELANADSYQYIVLNDGDPIPANPDNTNTVEVDNVTAPPVLIEFLSADTSYDVYVRADCGGTFGDWSDVLDITTEVICPAPTELAIDTDLTTDVSLTFSFATANNSSATEWEVVACGDAPFAGNDVATGTTTDTTVTVTGLMEQTCYEVYIRNNCPDAAPDDVSTVVGPESDTTACSVKIAPYAEDFTGTSVNGDPECFTQPQDEEYNYIYTNVTSTNAANDAVDHTDGAGNEDFAYVDGSAFISDTPGAGFLVSPTIDVSGLEFPALRFSVHSQLDQAAMDAGESYNSLTVQVSSDGGDTYETVESLFGPTDTSDPALPGWEDFIVDLTDEELDGELVVRFNTSLTGSTPFENDILVDDFSMDELGCQTPIDIDVDDIEFDNVVVELEGFSSAVNGNQVIVVEAGDDPLVPPFVFDGIVPFGEDEINVTGLDPLTCYDVYVRALCDGETSDFSAVVEFCTPGECDEPDDLEVDNITNMGADLSWDAVDGVVSYDYVVTNVGGDPDVAADAIAGTAGNTTDTMVSVNLPDGESFEFHVRSVCNEDGAVSVWATSDVFMTEIGCNSDFFDTGGIAGDYTDLENYCTTIFPSENASAVSLEFTLVDLEFGEDFLSVYNGTDQSQPLNLDVQGPSIFTSTDASGALTVCFESDGAGVGAGWEATITCSLANDVCSTSIELIADEDFETAAVEVTSTGANTPNGGADPSCGFFSGNGDGVWYTVEVPESTNITIETQETVTGTNPILDTAITVYTGSCGALTEVACDDDNGVGSYSLVSLTGLTAGETLYVRVFGSDTGGLTGDFRLAAYDASLSVNDLAAAGFNFYPNPVDNVLNLSAQENIQSVEVFNLLGQSVAKQAPDALNATVNMGDLKTGVYLVNVTINNQTGAYRIIKQ